MTKELSYRGVVAGHGGSGTGHAARDIAVSAVMLLHSMLLLIGRGSRGTGGKGSNFGLDGSFGGSLPGS